ncbi:hypothetical protein ACHAWF_016234 [Thalassiosira exigua]
MKPESPPKRASSRLRALARASPPSTENLAAAPPSPSHKSPRKALYKNAPKKAATAAASSEATGFQLEPKLPPPSNAAGFQSKPKPPAAPDAAAPVVRTESGKIAPPASLPVSDPDELERRRRQAREHALKGAGGRRVGARRAPPSAAALAATSAAAAAAAAGAERGRRSPLAGAPVDARAGGGARVPASKTSMVPRASTRTDEVEASASAVSGAAAAGSGWAANGSAAAAAAGTATAATAARRGATTSAAEALATAAATRHRTEPATATTKASAAAAAETIWTTDAADAAAATAVPAKRGRPRKRPPSPADAGRPKKRRGRPRKTVESHPPHPQSPLGAEGGAPSAAAALASDLALRETAAASDPTPREIAAHRGAPRVSQSLPNSGASSDNDAPLPLRRESSSLECDDDEYARFMRSIMGGDDQTIHTFGTWKTGATGATGRSMGDGSAIAVGSAFETIDEDDVSYQLTSDEEDEDDEDEGDEDENDVQGTANAGTEGETTRESPREHLPPDLAPPMPQTPSLLLDDDELLNVLGEIEGLMEEDLEAAAWASLAGGGGSNGGKEQPREGAGMARAGAADPGCDAAGGGAVSKPASSDGRVTVMGSQRQRAITTPGQSTKRQKSTTTVVTTPSPPPPGIARGRRVGGAGAGVAAAGAGAPAPARTSGSPAALEVPAVTSDQLARLRDAMALHHQTLLQQCALSVRAAYVQKVRKDGAAASLAGGGGGSPPPPPARGKAGGGGGGRGGGGVQGGRGGGRGSLPESRLDVRSLTFRAPPSGGGGCSYLNDFFGGETPEELGEGLDGSVGMLQDLEQNWKDAVRNSIQLSFKPPQPPHVPPRSAPAPGGPRNLNFGDEGPDASSRAGSSAEPQGDAAVPSGRPLTRSAFTRTLLERDSSRDGASSSSSSSSPLRDRPRPSQQDGSKPAGPQRVSVFDVRGLSRLKDTFSALDNSVRDVQVGREKGNNVDGINILAPDTVSRRTDGLGLGAWLDLTSWLSCLTSLWQLGSRLDFAWFGLACLIGLVYWLDLT